MSGSSSARNIAATRKDITDGLGTSSRPSLSSPTTSNTVYLGATPSHTPPALPPIPLQRDHPPLPPLLVTGGCGFIGKFLVSYILERHPNVLITIVDKQPPLPLYKSRANIAFCQLDLTDRVAVRKVLEEKRPQLIFSCAGLIPSPKIKEKKPFYVNNVDSVRILVEECLNVLVGKTEVKGFVHTSTSDTIKGTRELAGVDERTPYPKVFFDDYSESKAQGEQIILKANSPQFPTVCLRPHGIIGAEGHMIPILHHSLLNNETAVQIGDNKNLYDFVEVENYCAAVLLAAYNLLTIPVPSTAVGPQDLNYNYIDQASVDKDGNPISAAGHTFFITNLEPVYFWTWVRRVWEDTTVPPDPSIKIPVAAGFMLAYLAEFFSSTVRGKEPGLTKNRIKECCYNRWYRGDKAGHILGYWGGLAPDSNGYGMGGVGLWWGTKHAVYWYLKKLEEEKQVE
ncbi:hypothetical protein BDZ91DRAFT_668037 [Kalaharituber pfeilii]|nr:hypothetical protein BDZ91DRAFT_668037 [Kalaharituber pfeilii]